MVWGAIVSLNSPVLKRLFNSRVVRTRMEFEATNAADAKAYFEKFGTVISSITIKNDTNNR